MKLRCDVDGLDCPNCALELQRQLAKVDGVKDAVINFPLQSLVLELQDGADEDAVLAKVQAIGKDFEDGVDIDPRD